MALEEINFLRKQFLRLWKSGENFLNCKKLQIISKESASHAFVNQEQSKREEPGNEVENQADF